MRATVLILLALLHLPLSFAAAQGGDDLAAHWAQGGRAKITLHETGGATAREASEDVQVDETTRRTFDWASDWSWTFAAQVGQANGRLVGIAEPLGVSMNASERSTSYQNMDEGAVVIEGSSVCTLALGSPGPHELTGAGIAGRVDDARGVMVLEISGIASIEIPSSAWDPCESTSTTRMDPERTGMDGAPEVETRELEGARSLPASAHAIEARREGSSTFTIEVPVRVGETRLPVERTMSGAESAGYCGETRDAECVVRGELVVTVELGQSLEGAAAETPADGREPPPSSPRGTSPASPPLERDADDAAANEAPGLGVVAALAGAGIGALLARGRRR